jgi:hypothetical protein
MESTMKEKTLEELVIEARRLYFREYYARNKEADKARKMRYWAKMAQKMLETEK